MKFQKSILSAATGLAIAVTATTASAFSLGEVWVGDQNDGKVYIFDQSELNDASFDAVEDTIDLTTLPGGSGSKRLHLIGFTNHSGLDSNSRAHLAYLGGQMDILRTNGGTHAPTVVASLQISSSSLHMCGGNPANTEIACSSIGQKQLVKVSQDPNGADNYNITGSYPIADLQIAGALKAGTVARTAVEAAIAEGILNGVPICNNYSTNGKLLYVTVKGAPSGVIVLNSKNMKIRDAFTGTAVGCGLVNSADGKYMWTNAGSQDPLDDEKAYKFKFRHAYNNNKTGPIATVDLPETAEQGGDVHGAQFAGIGGPFLWQVMRLDGDIHVIEPQSAKLVNTINLETEEVTSPAADVLDRSAFGTRMYASLRGAIPTTAIVGNNDPARTPGVMVLGTLFGYNGVQLKTEAILSGAVAEFCPEAAGDGDEDHVHYELCDNTHPNYADVIEADTADPHGLKSLNYTSGGF